MTIMISNMKFKRYQNDEIHSTADEKKDMFKKMCANVIGKVKIYAV